MSNLFRAMEGEIVVVTTLSSITGQQSPPSEPCTRHKLAALQTSQSGAGRRIVSRVNQLARSLSHARSLARTGQSIAL